MRYNPLTASTRELFSTTRGRGWATRCCKWKIWAKSLHGELLFAHVRFMVNKGDKIAILSQNSLATTALYDILAGRDKASKGEFKWGVTINWADISD